MEKGSGEKANDFIVAQYNQTWESMRTHLRFSWQIPAFTMVAVVALLTTAPANLESWKREPLLTGLALLFLAMSVAVLFVHHYRNAIFVCEYGRLLRLMEQKYGKQFHAHHRDIAEKLQGFDRISSTSMLLYFLGLTSLGTLLGSVYFLLFAICH